MQIPVIGLRFKILFKRDKEERHNIVVRCSVSLPKCAEHREISAVAPQTFVLLPHLSEDPELQTGPGRCTPNSRLFITHCHRIIPKPTPPPTDVNAGSTSHHRALISISSNEAGAGSASIAAIPNNAATLLPSHHTPAKMARGGGVGGGGGSVRQAGADRHVAV